MSRQDISNSRQKSRKARVRKSIARSTRTRLTINRTAKHISAQLDDPETGKTIASATTKSKALMGDLTATGNIEAAVTAIPWRDAV